MTARFSVVRRLFEAVQEMPTEDRDAFLAAETAGDVDLYREVECLVRAAETSGEFLQHAVVPLLFDGEEDVVDEAELPAGYELGAYRLLRPIARGGFGIVYLAERSDDAFVKQVAVKVIKRGMDTAAVVARFLAERQILASLEHPNIARLLDGGATVDGLPYFVMEHIEGRTLTEFCSERSLGLAERLELFCQVCAAVAFAHRHLVVHRDLKPANILVTDGGIPKLLDFGLAKVLYPSRGESAVESTINGGRALTPDYASPEQIRGDAITTASDVYSLGVVLFELVCGKRPFPEGRASPYSSGAVPREAEPLAPSDVTSLPRDLECIILKAMREEPSRRYHTVAQLAEDVRRHLTGLPVLARKGTVSYRAGRFLRRHRLGVGAAALVALSLVVGLAATAWQARVASLERARAERRYHDLRQLATSLLVEFDSAIDDLPGATPARQILIRRALDYLTALAEESAHDPALQREVALAFFRMGELQARAYGLALGDVAGALTSFSNALSIHEAILAAEPESVADREALAACHVQVAQILGRMGDWRGHLRHARHGVGILVELGGDHPHQLGLKAGLAASLQTLGNARYQAGDVDGSLAAFTQLVALRDELVEADPSDVTARRNLTSALRNLSFARALTGDFRGASGSWERALVVEQELLDAQPANVYHRWSLSRTHRQIGRNLGRIGETEHGLEHLRIAFGVARTALRDSPNNALVRQGFAEVCRDLGAALVGVGDRDEARVVLEEGVALLEPWSRDYPLNVRVRLTLAQTLRHLGRAWEPVRGADSAEAGEWSAALSYYRRSAGIWKALDAEDRLSPHHLPEPMGVAAAIARGDAALNRTNAPL